MAKEKKITRNDGSYALDMENKKLSVTTSTGQHSILFEDIASTSYTKVTGEPEMKIKNQTALIIGVIAFILGVVLSDQGELGGILIVGGIIALFFGYGQEKKIWDNVTVETRGGKTVTYSVDLGQGKVDMDAIEEARRS